MVTAKYLTDRPCRISRPVHSGATVLDFHQLPHAVTYRCTLRALDARVNRTRGARSRRYVIGYMSGFTAKG
jgi:hypothetical protein